VSGASAAMEPVLLLLARAFFSSACKQKCVTGVTGV
jgi:hypothetical protein